MSKFLLHFYAWSMAMFFGAILSETVLLYPNIFSNVPDSLSLAMDFMKVIGPGQFFPKAGSIILLIAIATIVTNVKRKPVLNFLLISILLMGLFEFLFSLLYFRPRNIIMFIEGINVHTPEKLIRVANEFQLGHWIRLSVACITSCLAFMALYQSKNENNQQRYQN